MLDSLQQIVAEAMSSYGPFIANIAIGAAVFLAMMAILRIAVRLRSRDIGRLGAAARKNQFLIFFAPILNRLAFIANYTGTASHRKWIHTQLRNADVVGDWSVDLVETLKIFCGLTAMLVVFLLMLTFGFTPSVTVMIASGLVTFCIPDIMFYSMAKDRMNRILKSLPFLLDLMTVSAETGLSFQQSIRNVVANCSRGWNADDTEKSGERELAEEFDRIAGDIRTGRTMSEALVAAADRVNLDEFRSFTSAMLQAERLGSPIVDTLRQQAEELRIKLAARAEARAAKAPVQILFPLMIFIFPVTAWVIVGPVIITLIYGDY